MAETSLLDLAYCHDAEGPRFCQTLYARVSMLDINALLNEKTSIYQMHASLLLSEPWECAIHQAIRQEECRINVGYSTTCICLLWPLQQYFEFDVLSHIS